MNWSGVPKAEGSSCHLVVNMIIHLLDLFSLSQSDDILFFGHVDQGRSLCQSACVCG